MEVQPFTFALDVAALASRREYLNLDKWLADHAAAHGVAFIRDMVEFLRIKVQHEQSRMYDLSGSEGRMMLLNASTVSIFLRAMKAFVLSPAYVKWFASKEPAYLIAFSGASLTQEEHDHMMEVRNICLQAHPRLMSLVPNSDIEPGSTVVTYAPDIEAEVETIYRKLYDGSLPVEGLLNVLEAAKASDNARDHEIFAGVLHTVFDEYKFYPEYPARELKITAHLFGSIIQHRLVENVPLGIAIRYILSSLNDPKLFTFGVQALARFHVRLVEFPGVCHELLSMQHFVEAQPELAEQVRKALKYAETSALGDGTQPVFSSIQADDYEDSEIPQPSEEVSDKILFIVNNLAIANLDAKTNEMKEWYSDGVARWFAKYLVEERVSTEPNNHGLYLQFLDALGKPTLSKLILHESYAKSARLLNDENTLSSASDRVILKHLGSWLGKLTLEKDRPLKFKNLSLKDLLLEGFDCQRLLVAIPFTCKILEASKNSTVFRPPHNPWLMPILGLLVELYFQADLKLNQKFEIEVLFKDLDLIMDEVGPTNLLSTRPGRPGATIVGADLDPTGRSVVTAVNPVDGPSNGYIADTMNGEGTSGAMINDPEIALYLESLLMEMRPRLFFEVELEPYAAIPRFLAMVRAVFENATRETCVRDLRFLVAFYTEYFYYRWCNLWLNDQPMLPPCQLPTLWLGITWLKETRRSSNGQLTAWFDVLHLAWPLLLRRRYCDRRWSAPSDKNWRILSGNQ